MPHASPSGSLSGLGESSKNTMGDKTDFLRSRRYWDQEASSFDDAPDHGLRDPVVRLAWQGRLEEWLPPSPASVLNLGCGIGSRSAF